MESLFIKTDDNKVINAIYIRWVKQMNECLEVCTKSDECFIDKNGGNTHKICKLNSPDSYNKLNDLFR